MKYSIKNWQKFQHYKDRKPLWIKLYRDILDSMEWAALSGMASKNLIMIWLIGSEYDGDLPGIDTLAFRLRVKVSDLEKSIVELVSQGFLIESDDQSRIEKTTSKELRKKSGYGERYISQTNRDLVTSRNTNCTTCGSTENLEIDHIIPVSKGGNSELENLQILCRSCNRSKRARTLEQVATDLGQVATQGKNLRSLEKEKEKEKEKEERRGEVNGQPSVAPPCDSFHPEIIFICKNNPKTWTLTNAFLAKAKGIFPDLDLLAQIRLAKLWTERNEKNPKTAKKMEQFLLNWFGRANESKASGGQQKKTFDVDEFLRAKFAEVQP